MAVSRLYKIAHCNQSVSITRAALQRGAPQEDRNELAPLTHEEEHILRCLGAAVIMQWNDLPTKIQRELFEHASSMGELNHTAELKGQLARFLHQHKDDGRESA